MNNDKDFLNDPIFNELRKFGAKQIGPENMPAELFTAFRDAKTKKSINKWLGRTIVGVGFAAIALPSLSYAHVLPKPINNFVVKVGHIVSAPIRAVVSAVSSEPAPNENLISSSPSLAPTESANAISTQQTTPAISSTPIAKPTEHARAEHQESTESKKNVENSKNSNNEGVVGEAGGSSPKLPAATSTAPTINGGTGESKNVGESEKSRSKGED